MINKKQAQEDLNKLLKGRWKDIGNYYEQRFPFFLFYSRSSLSDGVSIYPKVADIRTGKVTTYAPVNSSHALDIFFDKILDAIEADRPKEEEGVFLEVKTPEISQLDKYMNMMSEINRLQKQATKASDLIEIDREIKKKFGKKH